MSKKTDKHYVSEIDQFLAEFDKTHPKSESQLAEISKYERVYQLRDTPKEEKKSDKEKLWEDF